VSALKTIEGQFIVSGKTIAIVATRFNGFIVESLLAGAVDALTRHGVPHSDLRKIYVPGAFELPYVVKKIATSGKVDAIIALGAVIRGSTPHFDYVAGECAKGVAAVSVQQELPIAFGVLTTDTIEQAVERAGTKAGNKGAEAAMVVLELLSLADRLAEQL
jgi:6,7-dimethyl-8-ribityllumazine synthase